MSFLSPLLLRVDHVAPVQPYYTNRSGLPLGAGPRGLPPSSAPRPVAPTHVYQAGPGSQMMMIPQQPLAFPSSPQGTAYFIPGQVKRVGAGAGGGTRCGQDGLSLGLH